MLLTRDLTAGNKTLVFRCPDSGTYAFWAVLRFSDEDAGNEHECSAKSHLQSCREHWSIHEPVAHPCDDPEFNENDSNCNPQGDPKLLDKERERVTNASQSRHSAAN